MRPKKQTAGNEKELIQAYERLIDDISASVPFECSGTPLEKLRLIAARAAEFQHLSEHVPADPQEERERTNALAAQIVSLKNRTKERALPFLRTHTVQDLIHILDLFRKWRSEREVKQILMTNE